MLEQKIDELIEALDRNTRSLRGEPEPASSAKPAKAAKAAKPAAAAGPAGQVQNAAPTGPRQTGPSHVSSPVDPGEVGMQAAPAAVQTQAQAPADPDALQRLQALAKDVARKLGPRAPEVRANMTNGQFVQADGTPIVLLTQMNPRDYPRFEAILKGLEGSV